VRFAARQDVTRVVIQHENLPDDEMGRMHEGGWSHYLDQVSGALVRPAKKTP
jgi:hypothetical protein